MADVYSVGFLDSKFGDEKVAGELLPLFHSCDAYWARSIISEKKIKPLFCNVFKEQLAYLFYGRPAYKNSTTQSSKLNAMFPVSFIIKSAGVKPVKRLAPFDTGAFWKELYKDFLHKGMRVENFLLSPDINTIPKFIHFFFETNEAYYKGEPRPAVTFDSMDFEIESYFELIRARWQSGADDRKASIEVQIDRELEMTQHNVEAIVIPSHLKSSSYVQDVVIGEWNAEVITYTSYGVTSGNNYTLLLHLVREYLGKKAYLYE